MRIQRIDVTDGKLELKWKDPVGRPTIVHFDGDVSHTVVVDRDWNVLIEITVTPTTRPADKPRYQPNRGHLPD